MSVACPDCEDDPHQEVVIVKANTGSRVFVSCPRHGAVEVELEGLRQWRIDPQVFAQPLAKGLGNEKAVRTLVENRAWSVGRFPSAGLSQAAVFVRGAAWANGSDILVQAKRVLAANRLMVFVPSDVPATATPGLEYVALTGRADLVDGALSIDLEHLDLGDVPDGGVVLTEVEEAEFQKYGFKSRIPVQLAATSSGGHDNIVVVGREEVRMPDADFVLLLLLVLGLFERADGYVPITELQAAQDESSRTTTANAISQYVSRLRDHFVNRLGTLSQRAFIETGRGAYRVSTHRRFVHWDQASLESHLKPAVRTLARRLAPFSE